MLPHLIAPVCLANAPQCARGHRDERGERKRGQGGRGALAWAVGGALRARERRGGAEGEGQREGRAGHGAVV